MESCCLLRSDPPRSVCPCLVPSGAARTNLPGLPDTAEATFIDAGGRWAPWALLVRLVNVFLVFTQLLSNGIYVLFIAQNVQPVRREPEGGGGEQICIRRDGLRLSVMLF